jgi:AraC family transcriptional regulator
VRNHAHDNEVIFLVLAGALSDQAKVGPREGETLHAGGLRALPAGDRRDLTFGPEGAVCLVVELHDGLTRDASIQIRKRTHSRSRHVTSLAAGLRRHVHASPSGSPLLLELDVLELLAQFAREQRGVRLSEPPRWLTRVREELEDASAYPDVDRLAEEAGMHPLHVVRAFKDHYGCAMGDVVRRIRLDRAHRLIVGTVEPLSHIAAATGFADQSHMTREVRREFGAPPARLRRAAGQR